MADTTYLTEADVLALLGNLEDPFITQSNANNVWMVLAGFLVLFMHAGFSMLETGSVPHSGAVNILFKNIGTVAIGAMGYYLLGYGFAYGTANSASQSYTFIGNGGYALTPSDGNRSATEDGFMTNAERASFFFQFVFAATGATIVSGAVAGRIRLSTYFIYAFYMTAFVYPVVSHWLWAGAPGDVAPWAQNMFGGKQGAVDYAGSGIVHMTGGVAAFWGALILGPRIGRFQADGTANDIPPHNVSLQALGVFILWFGWFGFNCGSSLAFDSEQIAKVAVNTTLAPSAACFLSIFLSRFVKGHYDIGFALNSVLAGLVSITAGCFAVPDWAAVIIGFIGCLVYMGASKAMILMKLDDPVDAVAVHGVCGFWGLLAVGIFSPERNGGLLFAAELCFGLAIFGWVTLTCVPFFLAFKFAGRLRVSAEDEERGLDASEHGGQRAFVPDEAKIVEQAPDAEGFRDANTTVSQV